MSFSVKYIMKLTVGFIYSNNLQTGFVCDPHFEEHYITLPDSVVSTAPRYGLDVPVIESQWGEGGRVPQQSRTALVFTQPPVQKWVLGLSRG